MISHMNICSRTMQVLSEANSTEWTSFSLCRNCNEWERTDFYSFSTSPRFTDVCGVDRTSLKLGFTPAPARPYSLPSQKTAILLPAQPKNGNFIFFQFLRPSTIFFGILSSKMGSKTPFYPWETLPWYHG